MSGCLLVLLYWKSALLSKNEEKIIFARHVGGSAVVAVALAGKMSFLHFLTTFDVAGYIETVWLRQSEALAVSREWMETQRALTQARQPSTVTITTMPANGNTPSRRLTKLLYYIPRIHHEEEDGADHDASKAAASVAVKVIAAEQSLSGFSISEGLLPAELPQQQIIAAKDILKTLLAGWGGGACFGERRMLDTTLRRRVLSHQPTLTGSPQGYDRACNG